MLEISACSFHVFKIPNFVMQLFIVLDASTSTVVILFIVQSIYAFVEGQNVINDPKCNNVLDIVTFCLKCNKLLRVITLGLIKRP